MMLQRESIFRYIVATQFVVIGLLHFTHADVFLLMMPPYLPFHLELVWLSGVFEVLGGVGLLVPQTRRWAAWGLLALLVAVFPANIHMALYQVELPIQSLPQSDLGRWIRLPFQLVIAATVWWAGLRRPGLAPDSNTER